MRLAIQLGWLVLFSIYVIRAGADTERKLINFLIIVGSTALGVAGTLVVEYLTDSSQEFALVVGPSIGQHRLRDCGRVELLACRRNLQRQESAWQQE